ncbi:MAG: hypothetical protein OQK78_07755 [Gammaproteobacteria bacterium]|nr:hypothetical protein [Gammaproteobacteria bacterium]
MDYLHELMPRFYINMKRYLDSEWPELSPQLDTLIVTRRCGCEDPNCTDFSVKQTSNKYQKQKGVIHYYDTSIQEIHPTLAIQGDNYLKGFEITNDYRDGYINRCLEKRFG